MQRKRLKTFARFLAGTAQKTESVRKRFYMGFWINVQNSVKAREYVLRHGKITRLGLDGSCGSAGCALGWAPSIPSFYKLGLRLEAGSFSGFPQGVRFGRWHDLQAGEEFFGLNGQEASHLFAPGSYPEDIAGHRKIEPKHVAEHIKHVLANKFR
jgi:hypothetical protein